MYTLSALRPGSLQAPHELPQTRREQPHPSARVS